MHGSDEGAVLSQGTPLSYVQHLKPLLIKKVSSLDGCKENIWCVKLICGNSHLTEELRRNCHRLLQQAKADVDSKVHTKSLKCVEKNRNGIAFQSVCAFMSTNSLFPKAHLFLSDIAVGLTKTSTWTPPFASLRVLTHARGKACF